MNHSPLIIGHRGASSHAPENTMAAFQMAIDAGADGVEFDVQLSKDGIPVVIHDANLKRTGLRSGLVADLTAKELGSTDVGSWFNTKYPAKASLSFSNETIPTLKQVLELYQNTQNLVYIELKYYDTDFEPLAKAVCDVIRDSPILSQLIVKSFGLQAISIVRSYVPEVQTAALFEPKIQDFLRSRKRLLAIAQRFGAHQISLHYSLVTKRLVELAIEAQMPVTIWTADSPDWVQRSRNLGIQALITNDPAKLIANSH